MATITYKIAMLICNAKAILLRNAKATEIAFLRARKRLQDSYVRTGASHFCRVALIPQPLLPRREKGGRIKVPLPPWERDLG